MNSKFHLLIITFLAIIFLGILVLSGNETLVKKDYTFVENAELNISELKDSSVQIGTVIVENQGFLPKKAKLKSYVICQISETFGNQYYNVGYSEGDFDNYYNDHYNYNIFGSGRASPYTELGSFEKKTLKLGSNVYMYNIKEEVTKNNLAGSTLPFYLFELNPEENVYNFCNSAQKEEAFKVINVKITN